MSFSSPGQEPSPWSASLSAQELPLNLFSSGGVNRVPVALVPANGASIRLNHPEAVQSALQVATQHYQSVTEVRQFGKGGLVCRSSDLSCISDLLNCRMFGSIPVSAFIPHHLACSKGIIRGVSAELSATDVLHKFADAGVIAVYRCSREANNTRVPTESVIATFAGLTCPSEIKVWPLVFRVDRLNPRPLQCKRCWRFGHSLGGCKSSLRCCSCGSAHSASECNADEVKCCLCQQGHPADYSNCPARAQEVSLLEVLEKRRCSRAEAAAIVRERAFGYAGVASRQVATTDPSLPSLVDAAIAKAMPAAVDRMSGIFSEGFQQMQAQMQMMSSQFSQLLQAFQGILAFMPQLNSNSTNPPFSLPEAVTAPPQNSPVAPLMTASVVNPLCTNTLATISSLPTIRSAHRLSTDCDQSTTAGKTVVHPLPAIF
ncbi:uncharacterized protein LOC144148615 [Haemaphysalis longicornis]